MTPKEKADQAFETIKRTQELNAKIEEWGMGLKPKETEVLPREIKCECGAEGLPAHTCPFREDVQGDVETLCNCCEACMYQCSMDI